MRTLVQSLQDHDRGYLRIVAELWGFDQPTGSGPAAAQQLSEAMLAQASEMATSLPAAAARVLELLTRHEGRLPLEELGLRFGPLREMGPGRRDREKPWAFPTSPLEVLWYRGLLARAFADSPAGPREYGFIPHDLAGRLPAPSPIPRASIGRSASKPRRFVAADSFSVDDATTILAACRRRGWIVSDLSAGRREWLLGHLLQPNSLDLLLILLQEGGLLTPEPQPEPIREFLESSREAALSTLQRYYLQSAGWNDLARVSSLRSAGAQWPNDPVVGRRAAIELLATVPVGTWWSTPDLVAAARQEVPHLLRPSGGFASWYLQRAADGAFLQGIESWDSVEGELLSYLVAGPLHWMGAIDLSSDRAAFRWSPLGAPLREPRARLEPTAASGRSSVRPDGRLQIARLADRALRYQIARISEWESADRGGYAYRLAAGPLRRALTEGLTVSQAQRILTEAAGGKPPKGILRALERWAEHGQEAELRPRLVLEVQDPSLVDQLSADASTGRFLKERLGPTSVTVELTDWKALSKAALRLGLLIGEPEDGSPR
jgi:hypothetical protein